MLFLHIFMKAALLGKFRCLNLTSPNPVWKNCQKTNPNTIYCIYTFTRVAFYKCSESLPEIRSFWFEIFLSLWKPQQCKALFLKKVDFLIFHKKSKKMAVTHKEDFFHTPIFNRKIFILKSFFKSMQEYVVTKSLSGKTNSQAWKKCQRSFTHWNLLQTWSGQEYWGFTEAANNCCGFNVSMLIRML